MTHLSCPVCTLPHGVMCSPFRANQDSLLLLCWCMGQSLVDSKASLAPEPQRWHRAHWVAWSDLSQASLIAVHLSLFKSSLPPLSSHAHPAFHFCLCWSLGLHGGHLASCLSPSYSAVQMQLKKQVRAPRARSRVTLWVLASPSRVLYATHASASCLTRECKR